MAKKSNRQAELARIHIAKKDLGMNDDEYRTMLYVVTGKSSAAELTAGQRYSVLDHLRSLNDGPAKSYPGRPHNMAGNSSRVRQMEKIEALLTIGEKPWAYGDAMAQRICKVDKLTWVDSADLYKIITALRKQAKREGWDLNE